MIQDLNKYLERTLVSLYRYRESGGTQLPFQNVSAKRENKLYSKQYEIVDYYTWLQRLRESTELQSYTPDAQYFLEVASRYRTFIDISSKRVTDERELKLARELSNMLITNEFLESYVRFTKIMEEIQIMFYGAYGPNNNSTNPVTIIPWSYGLNRCANELYIIKDGDTEGAFDIEINKIQDIRRISSNSKIKLVHYDVNLQTNNHLPERWKTLFKSVKEGLVSYPPRLELVNESFSQHCFQGYKYIDELEEEVFLLNYPMLLKGAEDMPVTKNIELTKIDTIKTTLESNIKLKINEI